MSGLLFAEGVAAHKPISEEGSMPVEATAQPVVPERSLAQRLEALQHANDVRSYRAALKRDVKHGRRSTAEVVAAPEDELATMKVFDLLLSTPKIGRVKADKWLRSCGISPGKTLAGLTDRQRRHLVSILRGGPLPGVVRRW